MAHQPFGRREAQFAVADLIRYGTQIGALRVYEHDEVVASAFLIPQKQILAVRRVDAVPVLLRLVNRRHRRMLVALEANTELRQAGRHEEFEIVDHSQSIECRSRSPSRRASTVTR